MNDKRTLPRFQKSNKLLPFCVLVLMIWSLFRLYQIQQDSDLAVAESIEVKVIRVIDGDTFLIENEIRVRLLGIDTPETKHPTLPPQPFGPEATDFTKKLIEGETVRLLFDKERYDDYRRLLAFVYLADGQLLNEQLVRAGLATTETQYPYRSDMKKLFSAAEDEAQHLKLGIWSILKKDDLIN